MRRDALPESLVCFIAESELPGRFLHQARQCRVMDVTDLGEQVMLDLEVQAPDKPGEQSVAASKIQGRFKLVHRPGSLHPGRAFASQWERRLLHTMCQLKHDRADHA